MWNKCLSPMPSLFSVHYPFYSLFAFILYSLILPHRGCRDVSRHTCVLHRALKTPPKSTFWETWSLLLDILDLGLKSMFFIDLLWSFNSSLPRIWSSYTHNSLHSSLTAWTAQNPQTTKAQTKADLLFYIELVLKARGYIFHSPILNLAATVWFWSN